ncbi:winged helix-turn-helix transcriptional regulator [Nocardia asteroides]|uniref:winged helix-turn-helix transcriptional regulator n=1 Tax=Nocardia asteroides TaxID=1824 RepID=UPI001E5D0ED8|nr:helix-turn-helix domain-containing protein [Nocardia asteroides]UGT63500.1 helix-turn-helix transcriptional regulator [Nocardia asteroides]
MRRTSFADMNCSLAQCLEVVGEWWTLLIVRDALLGVTRFDDFRSRLGIARNVLTQRLEHLVEHGILAREPYQENPVRHDYRLTEKGRALWLVVTAMRQWGDEWAAADGPPIQLRHKTCGHLMTVEPVCSECGEPVRRGELRALLGPGARDESLLPTRR